MRPDPHGTLLPVDDLTHRIVRRLRADGSSMSRNRNFHTFEDPKAMRALRIVRQLRSLESALPDRAITVTSEGDVVSLLVRYPELNATRTAYLTHDEWELLLAGPDSDPGGHAAGE